MAHAFFFAVFAVAFLAGFLAAVFLTGLSASAASVSLAVRGVGTPVFFSGGTKLPRGRLAEHANPGRCCTQPHHCGLPADLFDHRLPQYDQLAWRHIQSHHLLAIAASRRGLFRLPYRSNELRKYLLYQLSYPAAPRQDQYRRKSQRQIWIHLWPDDVHRRWLSSEGRGLV